jgi:hypothetical protein
VPFNISCRYLRQGLAAPVSAICSLFPAFLGLIVMVRVRAFQAGQTVIEPWRCQSHQKMSRSVYVLKQSGALKMSFHLTF